MNKRTKSGPPKATRQHLIARAVRQITPSFLKIDKIVMLGAISSPLPATPNACSGTGEMIAERMVQCRTLELTEVFALAAREQR
jgi:hypothetical protein